VVKIKTFIAFTLAEVLITLGIIGVVAALTIPTLIKTYQQQVVTTSLQKFYSTIQQAIKLSEADNGQIATWTFPATDYNGSPANLTVTFLNTYILPYLKVAKNCDLAITTDCWNPVNKMNGTSNAWLSNSNANIAKYSLQNGQEIAFLSYTAAIGVGVVQVLVDINGPKPPNMVGNDVFLFLIAQQAASNLNAGNGDMAQQIKIGGLYPDGYELDPSDSYTFRGCGKDVTYLYSGAFCSTKIMGNSWQIPSDYPFFN